MGGGASGAGDVRRGQLDRRPPLRGVPLGDSIDHASSGPCRRACRSTIRRAFRRWRRVSASSSRDADDAVRQPDAYDGSRAGALPGGSTLARSKPAYVRSSRLHCSVQQRRRIRRRAGSATQKAAEELQSLRTSLSAAQLDAGGLLRQPSRTEGVNGNGRKQRIGRIGRCREPCAQRAVMERGNGLRDAVVPRGRPPVSTGPAHDLSRSRWDPAVSVVSGRFRTHRRSGWLCRSGPSGWLPKQPSALNSSCRGRCSFCVLLRCGPRSAACVFCVAVGMAVVPMSAVRRAALGIQLPRYVE